MFITRFISFLIIGAILAHNLAFAKESDGNFVSIRSKILEWTNELVFIARDSSSINDWNLELSRKFPGSECGSIFKKNAFLHGVDISSLRVGAVKSKQYFNELIVSGDAKAHLFSEILGDYTITPETISKELAFRSSIEQEIRSALEIYYKSEEFETFIPTFCIELLLAEDNTNFVLAHKFDDEFWSSEKPYYHKSSLNLIFKHTTDPESFDTLFYLALKSIVSGDMNINELEFWLDPYFIEHYNVQILGTYAECEPSGSSVLIPELFDRHLSELLRFAIGMKTLEAELSLRDSIICENMN